jgi:hypothetical protein
MSGILSISYKKNGIPIECAEFLKNRILRNNLLKFTEKEYSQENINFWLAVDRWIKETKIANNGDINGSYLQKAVLIYYQYIEEINISDVSKKEIEKNFKTKNITINFFDNCIEDINKIIVTDIIPRFLNSDNWKEIESKKRSDTEIFMSPLYYSLEGRKKVGYLRSLFSNPPNSRNGSPRSSTKDSSGTLSILSTSPKSDIEE